MPSLVDCRGDVDRDGRTLEVTHIALGDMIATAAGLATGVGAAGVPAAPLRGLSWTVADTPAAALVRPIEAGLLRRAATSPSCRAASAGRKWFSALTTPSRGVRYRLSAITATSS